jgi:hypothetical protein
VQGLYWKESEIAIINCQLSIINWIGKRANGCFFGVKKKFVPFLGFFVPVCSEVLDVLPCGMWALIIRFVG